MLLKALASAVRAQTQPCAIAAIMVKRPSWKVPLLEVVMAGMLASGIANI